MKKISAIVLFTALAATTFATDIVVKPGPYAIENALQQAREERRLNGVEDVCIKLQSGTYRLNQSIVVRPEDNGTHIIA